MRDPARAVRLRGETEYRDEGESLLETSGDAVIVRRGTLRSVLMRCPDGCGQTLMVNLDPRAGKAWDLDTRGGKVTLFPSVWRDGGCGSHFIVWRDRILWCDRYEDGNVEPPFDSALEGRVLATLRKKVLRDAKDIAAELDEIPWEVMRAARALVHRRMAIAGGKERPNWFALA